MKISAKTEYACIAMLELAERFGSGEPVRIRTIAEEHGVPARFLVQILLQLKGAGFVTSTRGASGGYQLVKAPEEISLGEVMSVIEGAAEPITSSASPESRSAKVLQAAWQEVADVERHALYSITFADLIERARKSSENMYYI
ncbi:MAG TPA: Rrf2 family transcriptional regulator [Pirellulales bacterium]|nr:Rrf2 family transcriptional regulator [Pirellulales bacterium]